MKNLTAILSTILVLSLAPNAFAKDKPTKKKDEQAQKTESKMPVARYDEAKWDEAYWTGDDKDSFWETENSPKSSDEDLFWK